MQIVIDIDEDIMQGIIEGKGDKPREIVRSFQATIADAIKNGTPQPQPNIKALGEDMRICQKSITDEKVLIGFNMAVALCNKHLAESEE